MAFTFNNRYEVRHKLDTSEDTAVFLAYDTLKSIEAYVKVVLFPAAQSDFCWKQLFVYYTHTFSWLQKLNFPGVYTTTDFGQVTLAQDDSLFPDSQGKTACYFATPRPESASLLGEGDGNNTQQVIENILRLLPLLSFLHDKGIFHYGISPYNIVVGEQIGLLEVGVIPPGHSFFS